MGSKLSARRGGLTSSTFFRKNSIACRRGFREVFGTSKKSRVIAFQRLAYPHNLGIRIVDGPDLVNTEKRPAGQKIGDRITLFAAALEAASDGEEQTQTIPEDGP